MLPYGLTIVKMSIILLGCRSQPGAQRESVAIMAQETSMQYPRGYTERSLLLWMLRASLDKCRWCRRAGGGVPTRDLRKARTETFFQPHFARFPNSRFPLLSSIDASTFARQGKYNGADGLSLEPTFGSTHRGE